MSQDEVPKARSLEPSHSLFLILRNTNIECGYLRRQDGSNEWTSVAQSVVPTSSDKQSLSDLNDALKRFLPQSEGEIKKWRDIHVIASERWVQSLSIPWSQALLQAGREQTFLREQFLAGGVAVTAADRLQVGEGPPGQPRLAVLYPDQLVGTLRSWASQLGGVLVSIQPLYLAGWAVTQQLTTTELSRENSPRPPWRTLALADNDSVCLLYGPAGVSANYGVIEGINHRHVDLIADEYGGLQLAWKRFVLRNPQLSGLDEFVVLNVSKVSLIFLRQDGAPTSTNKSSHAKIEDLIQAAMSMIGHPLALEDVARPWKPWHWIILLALLLTVFAIVIRIGVSASEYRSLTSKTGEIERHTAGLQVTKKWSKEEINRIQSINKAVRDLNVPVDALLEAIIPPKDLKVAVLGMETVGKTLSASSKSSGMKLLGQACSTADMARYVAFVSNRKPFTGASLLRHEFSEKLGRCPYKFTVEAKWSD